MTPKTQNNNQKQNKSNKYKMKLNQKIPYIQVKRPIKINKYHLKSLQDTYSKNTREGATQKQSTSKQKKKRYKTVSNLF